MKSISIAFLLLALIALVPRASAQSPDPKSAAADASGRAHFQRGQRLSARGDYAAAYREFAAGYAVTRRPLFLFNMGEAARANGDVAKAREAYLEFLRVDPRSALAATAQARLAELDGTSGADTSRPTASRVAPGASNPTSSTADGRRTPGASNPASSTADGRRTPGASNSASSTADGRHPGASADSSPADGRRIPGASNSDASTTDSRQPPAGSSPALTAEGRPAAISSKDARATDRAPGASSPSAISTTPNARPDAPLLRPSAAPPRPPAASVVERPPPDRVATAREEDSAPVWKKWPFWAVVGGAIAGGVAVYAVTRGGTTCGTGCSEINFR